MIRWNNWQCLAQGKHQYLQAYYYCCCCWTYSFGLYKRRFCACVLSRFSCVPLCNPMYCSLLVSSVHGILQSRILECIAMPSSRESSQRRDGTHISCTAGGFFTVNALWDGLEIISIEIILKIKYLIFVVQSLSCVWFFVIPMDFRLTCSSLSPRVCSNSCPLCQWCHPTISSSVTPSPPALNLSQHQGLFQWVGSSHQMTKVLELQLQHQPLQWIFKVDFL